MLGDALVRIKGSPSTCALVKETCALAKKSPITISAKRSPMTSATSSPTTASAQMSGGSELVEVKHASNLSHKKTTSCVLNRAEVYVSMPDVRNLVD